MDEHLFERLESVAKAGLQLFADEFETHIGRLNVITLFAADAHDFQHMAEHLDDEGEKLPDNFYVLNEPLVIANEIIAIVRISAPEDDHKHIGECDFALDDWLSFENTYKKKKWIEVFDEEDFHTISYDNPEANVVLAFTNPPLTIEDPEEGLEDEDASAPADNQDE